MSLGASVNTRERTGRWRRRKLSSTPPSESPDDDCGSLTWLLSFRLDTLVAGPELEPEGFQHDTVKETKKLEVAQSAPQSPTLRKPPYTYPELIERALRERGELTVSAIYQWISERFPFYKNHDERWKNSVRHNLSINPHFRKGARAPHGAGHLWSLAANAVDLLPVIVLDEAAIAAASILPDQDFICETTAFLNPVPSEQVLQESGLTFPYASNYY